MNQTNNSSKQNTTPRADLIRLGLLPRTGERAALYQAALRELDLSVIDYQTIRDVLEIAHLDDSALDAALIALFAARNEGSLCVRADAASLSRRLPAFAARETLIDNFLRNMQSGNYDAQLLGHDELSFKPVILREEFLYFQRFLHDECILRDTLQHWLATSENVTSLERLSALRSSIAAVLDRPTFTTDGAPISLNPEQQVALALALLQSFTVITGGPGTGKTCIIFAILRCLLRMGGTSKSIALTAPTGRAAQRMSESLRQQLGKLATPTQEEAHIAEIEGQTIHRLLGYSPSRNTFTFNRDNPLALDVVVVDEVSMIDVNLMARLLEAVPTHAKLILLGDAQQLPSVEAGNVLADLAQAEREPSYSARMIATIATVLPVAPALSATQDEAALINDRIIRLRQSHRSGPNIMKVAAVVNDFSEDRSAELFSLLAADEASCNWEDAAKESGAAWCARLNNWIADHYQQAAYCAMLQRYRTPDALSVPYDEELTSLLRQLTQAKILTAIHAGRYGCDTINAYLAESLRHHLDPHSYGRYFVGAPIMITRNDYTLELFNGDTGIMLRDCNGGLRVAFPRGEQALLVPLDCLPEHSLAFAVTIHKSQGSEYEHVLLVLPNADSPATRRLITREIVYTGLTRAKQTVTIHSTQDALLQACLSKVERDSGLSLWDPAKADRSESP